MSYQDFILAPIYFILLLVIGVRIKEAFFADREYSKYFMPALSMKMVFAIIAGLVYKYYYAGGDTYYYFMDSFHIARHFPDNLGMFFQLLTVPPGYQAPELQEYTQYFVYYNSDTAYFVVRLAAIASVIGFGSYSVIALIFAFTSFLGVWLLYVVFVDNFPQIKGQLALATLFLPSIVFWGSGLFKDTVAIGCMGMFVWGFYKLFIRRERLLFAIVIMIFCGWMMFQVKIYLLMSLLPSIVFWLFMHYKNRINNGFIRFVTTPILIAGSVGIGFILIQQISEESSRFSFDNIQGSAESMQIWHYNITGNDVGSGYALEGADGSTAGMLSLAPVAIGYTFFRPFIWEAKNPAMLLSAFESTFLMLLFIYLVFKTRFFGMVRIINAHPFLIFAMVFTLVFGFAVGYSSYNFGALSRYKIPCIPFFVGGLFIILEEMNRKRKEKMDEQFSKNIGPPAMRAVK